MNELVTRQQNETGLAIGTETKELIQSSIEIAHSGDTRSYRNR